MTKDERELFTRLVQVTDALLEALSCGCGIQDFTDIRREWHTATEPVRLRIDAERKAVASREEHG